MIKLLKILVWVLAALLLFIGVDQFMLRVPLDLPGVKPAQTFYVDFRSRLLTLFGADTATVKVAPATVDPSIEQVIESNQGEAVSQQKGQRYLYVDGSGALQFADSLEQVPSEFRAAAEPLAE